MNDEYRRENNENEDPFGADNAKNDDFRSNTASSDDDVRDEDLHDDTFDPDDPEPRREAPRSDRTGFSSRTRAKNGSRSSGRSSTKVPKKEKIRLKSQ